jgi:hypothetical protein
LAAGVKIWALIGGLEKLAHKCYNVCCFVKGSVVKVIAYGALLFYLED